MGYNRGTSSAGFICSVFPMSAVFGFIGGEGAEPWELIKKVIF